MHKIITKTALLAFFFMPLMGSTTAFAQQTALSKIERAKLKGQLRHKCRILSQKIAPQLTSTQFMENTEEQNEARSAKRDKAFLTCLKLSSLKNRSTPSLARLQKAMPRRFRTVQRTGTDALKATTSLTIKTNPEQARIRILNINPVYKDGIKLHPGLYHIRVEKPGYHRWDKWLKVKKKNFVYYVALKPKDGTVIKQKQPHNTASLTQSDVPSAAALAQKHQNQKRDTQREAFIKAELARKQALKALRAKQDLALIQKQGNIAPASRLSGESDREEDSTDQNSPEQIRFMEQVRKNRLKIEQGLKLLRSKQNNNDSE